MAKVKTGHERKKRIKEISRISIVKNIIRSKNIKKVFTKIPIPIEKTTKPFLYSFFNGLKKVLIKIDKESISRHARLTEEKKRIKLSGAPTYQNLKN